MPLNRSRVQKRMHQACDNCRKKKSRCPGERPVCSSCARLYQACRYNGVAATIPPARPVGQEMGRSLEGRLAQLEDKMELMLKRGNQETSENIYTENDLHIQQSIMPRGHSPTQSRQITPRGQTSQPTVSFLANNPEPFPPRGVLLEAIELYFQLCHRQPLWLLEREEITSPYAMAEELIFALLALTVRFLKTDFYEGQSHQELSQKYGDVARGYIMSRIGQGTVQLSTIQSLCILSFTNFTAKETHLAWFHISLATSLANVADMNFETAKEQQSSSILAESKRKLFYSIYLLNQTYAPRSMLLNMLEEIEHPKYLEPHRDVRQESGQLPPLTPQDSSVNFSHVQKSERAGIWTYMVQQSSLWREVRGYVAQCANGSPKPPWSPESGYAVIGAHLMELETRFPTYHRYDAVKFLDRSTEELRQNRDYWSPWLCIQFVYHTIHSMLNHPFLYSSRPNQSMQMSVPNTFWKTSSELAFLHSTWTVRLIDMVWEKEYRVSDPFLGYCAAVAATIHIYYCRAADLRVRTSSQSKLGKCMRFVDELGKMWPVCRLIHNRLGSLVKSALESKSHKERDGMRRTVSINTGLMWDILDYTCPKTDCTQSNSNRSLFDSNFVNTYSHFESRAKGRTQCDGSDEEDESHHDHHYEDDDEDDDEVVVETQIFHHPNPTTEVDTSNGGQEFPPCSGTAAHRTRSYNSLNPHGSSSYAERSTHSAPAPERPFASHEQQQIQNQRQQQQNVQCQNQEQDETNMLLSWPADDMWMGSSIMDVNHDPFFQFQDQDIPWAGSWKIGNL